MNVAYKNHSMAREKQDVNYVTHWNNVTEYMVEIEGFTPVHIALYNAIFQTWNSTGFKVQFDAYRDELMKLALIRGTATYHKTLEEIIDAGLIEYHSNKSIHKASYIKVKRFDEVQERFTGSSGNEQHSSSEVVHRKFRGCSEEVQNLNTSLNNPKQPKQPKLPKEPKQKKEENPLSPFQDFENEKADKSKNIQEVETEDYFESKAEKKERKKSCAKKSEVAMPWDDDEFKHQWELWKDYRKKEHNFCFKAAQSEQAALSGLSKKADGDMQTAIAIIHQSLEKGWKGFFDLKNENGNGKQQSYSGFEADLDSWFANQER